MEADDVLHRGEVISRLSLGQDNLFHQQPRNTAGPAGQPGKGHGSLNIQKFVLLAMLRIRIRIQIRMHPAPFCWSGYSSSSGSQQKAWSGGTTKKVLRKYQQLLLKYLLKIRTVSKKVPTRTVPYRTVPIHWYRNIWISNKNFFYNLYSVLNFFAVPGNWIQICIKFKLRVRILFWIRIKLIRILNTPM